jgi:predicted AlkP superfamily pyrophosphatase or phosphodiesterase
MPRKLLVMMIDGISAEHYDDAVKHLPHFRQLQERGFLVNRLKSEMVTAFASRASILSDDIHLTNLPAYARAAGLTVASIGMEMVRPEDADIFVAPWWVDDTRIGSVQHCESDAFIRLCEQAGIPSQVPAISEFPEEYQPSYSIFANHLMADWVSLLATSDQAPDLLLTEFLIPDSLQHEPGYLSPLSEWALEQVDVAVGEIMLRLQEANALDQWDIVMVSEHAHSLIEKVISPQKRKYYPKKAAC